MASLGELATYGDLSRVASVAVSQARSRLVSDGAHLTLWDEGQRLLVSLCFDDHRFPDPDPVLRPGQGIMGETYARDRPMVANDYMHDVATAPQWASQVQSAVAVPLHSAGLEMGVLAAHQYTPRAFAPEDVEALDLVGRHLAPVLGAMGTLARAQRRDAEARTLAALIRSSAETTDSTGLEPVCETAKHLLGADVAGVVLRGGSLARSGWHGVAGDRTGVWRAQRYGSDHPVAPTVYGTARTIIRGSGEEPVDARRFPFFNAEGVRTGLILPFGGVGRGRGALCVGWRFAADLSEPQVQLGETLAAFCGSLATMHAIRGEHDAVMTRAPIALAALDEDGVITLCEGAGAAELGVGPQDVGRRITDILGDDPVALSRVTDALARSLPARAQVGIRDRQLDLEFVARDGGAFVVATDVTRLRAAQHQVARQSAQDALTGLMNRESVVEAIETALTAGPVGAVLIDVAGFGDVNEMFGYAAGDALLRELARRLLADLPDAVVVGRTGGDEFAIAVAGTDPRPIAERVRSSFGPTIALDGQPPVRVDVHCGAAAAGRGESARDLLRRADSALQHARRDGGRERVEVWDADVAERKSRQLHLTRLLHAEAAETRFDVAYQPIVDARTGALHAIEALARWTPTGDDPVSPAVFVPLLERMGQIERLTATVLDRAVDELAGFDCLIHVNVSPLDLTDGLPALVDECLARRGVPGDRLVLEVTESSQFDAAQPVLEELRSRGVGIAVDDFGRGWSSLELLRHAPARYLKLDRFYVVRADSQPTDAAITRAAISLGRALDMQVIAEGIEDAEALATVRELGCRFVQGFYVGRPMPVDALEDWTAGYG